MSLPNWRRPARRRDEVAARYGCPAHRRRPTQARRHRPTTPEAPASACVSSATGQRVACSASNSSDTRHAEIAKRIDIAATAISHGMTVEAISDVDLSDTPPLGSPWDAIQTAAQEWSRGMAAVRRGELERTVA